MQLSWTYLSPRWYYKSISNSNYIKPVSKNLMNR